jgi:hypothetical protein
MPTKKALRKKFGDRGAALVEFAFVLPLLVALVFGMIEFGSAWRENAALTRLTSQASRTVSSLGTNKNADRQALTMIAASAGTSPRYGFNALNGDRVIVYNATDSDTPPIDCLEAPSTLSPSGTYVGSECITYFPSSDPTVKNIFPEINNYDPRDLYDSNAQCPSSNAWCGAVRGWFTQRPTETPPIVGVYIKATYSSLTGTIDGISLKRKAIYQMEPCAVILDLTGNSQELCPV